jgi:hypothetical protein
MMTKIPLLLTGLAVFIAPAAYGFIGWYRSLSSRRLIEGLAVSRCRSVAQGYVALAGRQKAVPGHPLIAPMTGRSCTWWSHTVEKRDNWQWVVIARRTSRTPLLLDDGTGQMMIDPAGARVHAIKRDRWYGTDYRIDHPPEMDMPGGQYRHTETRMTEGEPLYVAGLHTNRSAQSLPSAVEVDTAAILADWKNNQASLLTRFDANGDGVIDMNEWNRARDAAQIQAATSAVQPEITPEAGSISCPPDHRPFILSSQPTEELVRQLKLSGYGKLALFIGFSLAALWLAGKMLSLQLH